MIGNHGRVAVNHPFGEAPQRLGVQRFCKWIDGYQTPRIEQAALIRQVMSAYRELNLVAKALLDAGNDEIGALRSLQLLEQVWLVEPRHIQFARLIRDGGNSTCTPPTGRYIFCFPDQTLGRCHFIEGDVSNFYEFAVIAVFAREIEEQVVYGPYAQVMQFCGYRCPHTRNGCNISTEQGEYRVTCRHTRFQAHSILWCSCWPLPPSATLVLGRGQRRRRRFLPFIVGARFVAPRGWGGGQRGHLRFLPF